jgi:tRNA threonylcarbamoyl adenosine modification protein YeaZ
MNILSIDSTTGNLSVAVSKDEKMLSKEMDRSGAKHMVRVMGLVDRALSRAGLSIADIDIFGVNLGPGDFTGTRIGVSVIKILSWLEGKVAYGVDSLDVLALGMGIKNISFIARCLSKDTPALVMPCLDVRKGEVYFAFYSIGPKARAERKYIAEIEFKRSTYVIRRKGKRFLVPGKNLNDFLVGLFSGKVLKIPEAKSIYRSPVITIGGSCCQSYKKIMDEIVGQNKNFYLDRKSIYPEAEYLNLCSYFNKLREAEAQNLVPVYIREFVPFGRRKETAIRIKRTI